ncbi:hypothetical protein [Bdellovibrio sp.]|uniref:hypothetical protein n=1 Tax=Bdellovibrio sp. TaxID=28201 RepID=UPI0039E494D5
MSEVKRTLVDRDNLPKQFPTHRHTSEFWEKLGRTVATFSFLEEILKKAIFALDATKIYSSEEDLNKAYAKWSAKLESMMTDQLFKLSVSYHEATKTHQEFSAEAESVCELVEALKKASKIRNILCHGSWGAPDSNGKSLPFFINKNLEILETQIDVAFLEQVQKHVTDLICDVINSITSKGWRFPSWNNPGKPIF